MTTLTLKMEMDARQLALFKLPIFAQDLQVSAIHVCNIVFHVLIILLVPTVLLLLFGIH